MNCVNGACMIEGISAAASSLIARCRETIANAPTLALEWIACAEAAARAQPTSDRPPGLLLRIANLPADTGPLRRIVRLIDRYVIFLLQALDQLLDQFFKLAFHLHLLQTVAHFFIEHLAIEQSLFQRAL